MAGLSDGHRWEVTSTNGSERLRLRTPRTSAGRTARWSSRRRRLSLSERRLAGRSARDETAGRWTAAAQCSASSDTRMTSQLAGRAAKRSPSRRTSDETAANCLPAWKWRPPKRLLLPDDRFRPRGRRRHSGRRRAAAARRRVKRRRRWVVGTCIPRSRRRSPQRADLVSAHPERNAT